MMILCSFWCNV
uniref:Uncharacterized protein n=1 Tax=Arundo donax TaxID=35708 RepID=A0A0A9C2B8_ARUDO